MNVITEGFGSFGSVGAVVLDGYLASQSASVSAEATQTPAGRRKRSQLVMIGDDLYEISSREELEALLESRLEKPESEPVPKTGKPKTRKPVVVIARAQVSQVAKELAYRFYRPGDITLDWSQITQIVDDDEPEIEELILLH